MQSDFFINMLLINFIPGVFGGCIIFLYGLKSGHHRNNKYVAKLTLEISGASITAIFIGQFFSSLSPQLQIAFSFCIGVGWVKIIQMTRNNITKMVKDKLDGKNGKTGEWD